MVQLGYTGLVGDLPWTVLHNHLNAQVCRNQSYCAVLLPCLPFLLDLEGYDLGDNIQIRIFHYTGSLNIQIV